MPNGVYSLEQLLKLGQTGDPLKDFTKSKPQGMFKSPTAGTLPQNIPAGYYQIPGKDGMVYVDPRSGEVPAEFHEWVNSGGMKKDELTGLPIGYVPNQDTGEYFKANDPGQSKEFQGAIAEQQRLEALGLTRQQAQDKRLGTGANQSGVIGQQGSNFDREGRNIREPGYVPPSDPAGPIPGIGTTPTKGNLKPLDLPPPEQDSSGRLTPEFIQWSKVQNKNLLDSASALEMKNATNFEGLMAFRNERGLDPETGISLEEKKRIAGTYSRIQDPEMRKAFIQYQDPGNLTSALRQARKEARADQEAFMAAGPTRTEIDHLGANLSKEQRAALRASGGSLKTTIGSQMITDEATGRERIVGNIPTKVEFKERNLLRSGPEKFMAKTAVGQGIERIGRAAIGTAIGFLTAGPFGAAMGAYSGFGGPLPDTKNISFKDMKGFGSWKLQQPGPFPTFGQVAVGTALSFVSSVSMGRSGVPSGTPINRPTSSLMYV